MVVQATLDEAEESSGAHLERVLTPGLLECPGLAEWNATSFSQQMRFAARYYPHINDTGGFFVAKIVKS
jgi:16S rRNA C967 or C1407 C5-methylase (RsmB/RsmF family)